jgi:tetratricopeptide (TPR) repeat protein
MSPLKYLLPLLFLLVLVSAQAQLVPSDFIKTTDSLIKAKPRTHLAIDSVIGQAERDTVLMRYLAQASEKKGYLTGQSYALNQLGRRYRNISQYNRALALHQRALEAATQANNLEFKVFSLNMLSVVHRRTDAIKSALDYNQEALALAESAENQSMGIKRGINVSLNGIGNIYQALEQYALAIEYFEKSMKLEEKLGNKLGLAINHQNIGDCLEHQNKFDEALQSYRTSLAYNEEIDSDMGRTICKNSIAQIYIKQGRVEEAVEILEPTLMSSEFQGDMFITSAVHTNLGWAYMQLKKYDEAEKNLTKGLNLAKKHNLPRGISRSYLLLSELTELLNRPKEALDFYRRSVIYDSEITNERNLRYVTDMIIRYDSEKQSSQIRLLAQENEMVRMRFKKTQTVLLISGIALALLAGIFYILYRQYQLNNEKKLLTLEQSMLRSQMNPHFLFNSLNSIKLYIINNEQKNAVHYLNKFSKLVRKILEASSLKEIALAEELETVQLYMNIENIRFSNEINFTTTIGDGVDTHAVKIPSLILQPFLENAIWHGLSSKEGEKNVNLNISKGKNDYIHIAITDNGIGREAAEKIKQSKVLKRKSVGIDITKERLANFSRDYQNSFNVDMVDLYDDNKKSSGTRVILDIPTV